MEAHVNTKIVNKLAITLTAISTLISCAPGSSGSNSTVNESLSNDNSQSSTTILESYSAKPGNFRFSLTDAPAKQLKSVFVNVLNAEVWLKKQNKEVRVSIGKDIGLIDLMKLRNGVLLPVEDFKIPDGAQVTQIRLILGGGNYAIKSDDSTCSLQTPSAQQSGIKIKLSNAVTISGGKSYSLVVDFDAEKSVVVKGNGDCLLKPVLKIASFTKIDSEVIDDQGNNSQPGEDVTGGVSDSNTDSTSSGNSSSSGGSSSTGDTSSSGGSSSTDSSGYDTSTEGTNPPIIDPDTVVSYLL